MAGTDQSATAWTLAVSINILPALMMNPKSDASETWNSHFSGESVENTVDMLHMTLLRFGEDEDVV